MSAYKCERFAPAGTGEETRKLGRPLNGHLGGTVVKRPRLSRAIPAGHGFDALASRFAGIFLAFFPIGFSKVFQGVDG